METPVWALTLAYWLHMLATVVWIGALASLALLVIPGGETQLEPLQFANLIDAIQRRLDPLAWFCLALLVVTGLVQMSASPQYQGFLAIEGRWGLAILLKHLVFGGMIGASAYLTWGVLPGLRRAALLRSRGRETPEADDLRRRQKTLIRLNLALSMLVLALTALARTA